MVRSLYYFVQVQLTLINDASRGFRFADEFSLSSGLGDVGAVIMVLDSLVREKVELKDRGRRSDDVCQGR
jgi:hypothetical protein